MKKLISIALLMALLLTQTACGDTGKPVDTDNNDTVSGDDSSSAPETKPEYVFPELDCDGDTFTVLNASTTWGFYHYMDFESQTGEMLDDEVYARNRFIEDKFNLELEIVEDDIDQNYNKYRTAILAQDDVYDVAYIRCDRMSSFMESGYLYNLLDYQEFQLDKPWWDQVITEKSLIGDKKKLYFAGNDFSLIGFEGTLCCYFNENMLDDLGLETPYNLVREGKWTIDKLGEYAAAGANLNGDTSFAWNESGNAIYGMASYEDSLNAFITGGGENYVTIDDKGQPVLISNPDRFYNIIEKAFNIYSTEGEFIFMNGSGNSHYEMIFKNGRSLFTIAEIKASSKYRDMDDTFGIVPIPKYDENQDKYYSHRTHICLTMSVPVTNQQPERTGIIMDALSYLSSTNILPVFYNVKVAQKGLRNDDSIEMLGIISSSRSFDIGEGYAWTEELSGKVNTSVVNQKNNNVVSLVDSMRSSIEAAFKKTLEFME
ncbi:MAG: extracellular solute-binding protein [Clostridiales bacterium]|nr:extracellular solute-binding protein [Clostridiales bacterium]